MGDLTRDRPKPLIQVGGRALLDRAIDLTTAAAIGKVVVNAHYKAEMIQAHLKDRPDIGVSHETPEILETGGGLRQALPLLGPGPVVTLNSDAVWTGPNPIDRLRRAWDPTRMDALLLLVPLENALGHAGRGDFVADTAGRLSRGPGSVYSGAQIIQPKGLEDITDTAFSLNRLWSGLAARGRLFGVEHSGGWCDVGHPEGIALAETLIQGLADV